MEGYEGVAALRGVPPPNGGCTPGAHPCNPPWLRWMVVDNAVDIDGRLAQPLAIRRRGRGRNPLFKYPCIYGISVFSK
jgi:hypothetical protein